MVRTIFIILITLISVGFTSAQIKSVYTKLDDKHCRPLKAPLGSRRCSGVGGYRVETAFGEDHREADLIAPSGKNFGAGIAPAGHYGIGDTAEWRTKSGRPIAVIIRYYLMDPVAPDKVFESPLVVWKISRTKPCVTDIVKPSKNQNIEARKMADASRPCGSSINY